MQILRLIQERTLLAAVVAALLPSLGGVAWAAVASAQYMVSQLGRTFHPAELTIKRGETVQIVNDDGDLLHHVYLESDKFSFDSGDQVPGSRTDIVIPVTGDFTILCAIHPKMRLIVHVR